MGRQPTTKENLHRVCGGYQACMAQLAASVPESFLQNVTADIEKVLLWSAIGSTRRETLALSLVGANHLHQYCFEKRVRQS